jgi:tetratricopeptide (TPR) repeat protein
MALPFLNTLTTKFPEYPPGFLNLGYYHYLSGNLPEAEKAYHKALALNPRSAEACISLGNICLETGRLAEARTWYRTGYEYGGNSPDLQYDLARLEALARDQEQSLRHLEEALRLGYRNLAAITGNPELAPIRRLPSFDRMMASYFPDRK